MACRSIWWSLVGLTGLAGTPAWAGHGPSPVNVFLLAASSYRLPVQVAPALSPDPGPVPEYGALAELKTTAAVAMATANPTKRVIPGPDLSYRAGARGPLVEIAALGGGMDSAPSLAHVGVDWIF